jgi:ubiquinone/menaquinone biosynthesis C-methylase UbiE
MWALGDYHRFASELIWEFGPVLVEACGVSSGQRLLDVAAGTGNVAIRAAEAGADVIALDLTPEHLEAGRRAAVSRGVELDWVEGDAQALPFADGEFDVVTSSAGAMFAPDHQTVADELLRVCRSGGTIGMINFVVEGTAGARSGVPRLRDQVEPWDAGSGRLPLRLPAGCGRGPLTRCTARRRRASPPRLRT